MDPLQESRIALTRRHFFGRTAVGLGSSVLATLLGAESTRAADGPRNADGGLTSLPYFTPRAKRIIYLFQAGAPSQSDLFDPKPGLEKFRGQDLPASVRMGQRLTGMTSGQKTLPVTPTVF